MKPLFTFIATLFFLINLHATDLVIGEKAPPVLAKILGSEKTISPNSYKGQVLLINFWATWCAPCKAEMPCIDEYYLKHKDQGLEVIAISMDSAKDLELVKSMAKRYSFPVAFKTDADFKGFGRVWRLPSTFVIDREGLLRKNGHVGDPEVTTDILESVVTPLLVKP